MCRMKGSEGMGWLNYWIRGPHMKEKEDLGVGFRELDLTLRLPPSVNPR